MSIRLKFDAFHLKLFALLNMLGLIACFINIRLGIVSSVLIIIICLLKYKTRGYFADFAFIIYLMSSVISVIAYTWNNRPFVIFVQAISFNLIPSLLYFLGKYITKENEEKRWALYTLNAFCFMMIVGTVTYLFIPNFYYQYLGQSVEDFAYGLGDYRYGSFISSIALGSVASISIILYFYLFDNLQRWQRIVYLPIIILNVIMCMQRSAWIVASIALFGSLFHRFGNDRKSRLRIFGLLILFVSLIATVWSFKNYLFTPTQLLYFERRIGTVTLENMFSSRNNQWNSAIEVFRNNPITGFGLGSCGQKAAPFGMAVVTDGNHLRILSEIGIFGFIAFCYVNIRGIYRALKRKEFYFALAIVLYNIAAIGSPIFDQYYASFAYWLILGCTSAIIRTE